MVKEKQKSEGLKMNSCVHKSQIEYLKGMDKYIEKLKKMDKNEAAKISLDSLIRSGVLDKKGNPHNIVK